MKTTVFSEQGHDLACFRGQINRHCGTYSDDPAITAALATLYDEVLEDDQVIWSTLQRPPVVRLEELRFVHTIEADRRDIVAVLDGFIWESGILRRRIVPPDVFRHIRTSCHTLAGKTRHEAIDQKVDDYLARELPPDPWAHLVRLDTSCRMPQVLLSWPFCFSRITETEVIQL